jgi:hypothetical protein
MIADPMPSTEPTSGRQIRDPARFHATPQQSRQAFHRGPIYRAWLKPILNRRTPNQTRISSGTPHWFFVQWTDFACPKVGWNNGTQPAAGPTDRGFDAPNCGWPT